MHYNFKFYPLILFGTVFILHYRIKTEIYSANVTKFWRYLGLRALPVCRLRLIRSVQLSSFRFGAAVKTRFSIHTFARQVAKLKTRQTLNRFLRLFLEISEACSHTIIPLRKKHLARHSLLLIEMYNINNCSYYRSYT